MDQHKHAPQEFRVSIMSSNESSDLDCEVPIRSADSVSSLYQRAPRRRKNQRIRAASPTTNSGPRCSQAALPFTRRRHVQRRLHPPTRRRTGKMRDMGTSIATNTFVSSFIGGSKSLWTVVKVVCAPLIPDWCNPGAPPLPDYDVVCGSRGC